MRGNESETFKHLAFDKTPVICHPQVLGVRITDAVLARTSNRRPPMSQVTSLMGPAAHSRLRVPGKAVRHRTSRASLKERKGVD